MRLLTLIGIFLILSLLTAGGCSMHLTADTPVEEIRLTNSATGTEYWIYVPSYYEDEPERKWPLLVTLHGRFLMDNAKKQVREWRGLAEQKGFIVIAPSLASTRLGHATDAGLMEDIARDEKAVLAILDEVDAKYGDRINREAILLTGFAEGGYPLYYIGLRNPGRFTTIMARSCYSEFHILEKIKLTEDAKEIPVMLYWGRDDTRGVQHDSWDAFRFFSERDCNTHQKEIKGGRRRTPDTAFRYWLRFILPGQMN